MIQLPIIAVANQSFTAVLGGESYDITIKYCNGAMCCSISRNNVPVVTNTRMLPFAPIVPYEYLETGNFFLSTSNDEVADYTAFGVSQNLYYATAAEMEILRS